MSRDRMVAASDLDSVPGTDAKGRRRTSNVALDAFSFASLTSMGPETDTKAWVSPILAKEKNQKLDLDVVLLA